MSAVLYDVGFVYTVDGQPVSPINHETISADSGSDAVGKLYQRHPAGIHWITCRPTEAPAYDGDNL